MKNADHEQQVKTRKNYFEILLITNQRTCDSINSPRVKTNASVRLKLRRRAQSLGPEQLQRAEFRETQEGQRTS